MSHPTGTESDRWSRIRSRTMNDLVAECRSILNDYSQGADESDLDRRARRLAELLHELTGNTGLYKPNQ